MIDPQTRRAELIHEMLVGYAKTATPEQAAHYLKTIGDVDPDVLDQAIMRACALVATGFAPSSGEVVKQVNAITAARRANALDDYTSHFSPEVHLPTEDPEAVAVRRAGRLDAQASGYHAPDGIGRRLATIWAARTDAYREAYREAGYPTEEGAHLAVWAALNDACDEGGDLGEGKVGRLGQDRGHSRVMIPKATSTTA